MSAEIAARLIDAGLVREVTDVELGELLILVAGEGSRRELPACRLLYEVERAWVKKRLGCS